VVYPFVQELFLQAAASMGLRAVVLAALHPSYRPLEVLDRWVSCAFHSAAMHGHQELADEIAKLFQSPSSATNLMRGIVRFRAGRGLSIEGCSQYSLLFFSPDAHGSTPLHLAAFGGHADVVQMLLQKGFVVLFGYPVRISHGCCELRSKI
jgi:ankyrin repeat protein